MEDTTPVPADGPFTAPWLRDRAREAIDRHDDEMAIIFLRMAQKRSNTTEADRLRSALTARTTLVPLVGTTRDERPYGDGSQLAPWRGGPRRLDPAATARIELPATDPACAVCGTAVAYFDTDEATGYWHIDGEHNPINLGHAAATHNPR